MYLLEYLRVFGYYEIGNADDSKELYICPSTEHSWTLVPVWTLAKNNG